LTGLFFQKKLFKIKFLIYTFIFIAEQVIFTFYFNWSFSFSIILRKPKWRLHFIWDYYFSGFNCSRIKVL